MRKFLFIMQPSNDLGLLAQSIPIASELRNRGHQIIFCTSGKAPCKAISDAHFENHRPNWPLYLILTGDTRVTNFLRLPGSMHLIRDLGILSWYVKHMEKYGTSEIWNIDHFMYLLGMGNETYTRATVQTFSKMLVKHEPDAVVNFWNPFVGIAVKINKIPLVSVIQADLHPQSRGFIWWKEPPDNLPTPIRAINTVAAENQLPAIHSVGELSLGDLTLVLGIPETDPLPDASNIHYIGSLQLQNKNETPPNWMEKIRRDQPVIWVYPGNMRYIKGQDSPFDGMVILQACIEVLRNMNVQVVLSTGHHALPEEVLPLPLNFRHVPFVPGLAMAERCDLMIHHGGYGSSQTGLYTGTPALIIPTYSERESNARRIAALGAGVIVLPGTDASGKKKTIDTGELRAKIERMLSDRSYKENAARISKKLKKFSGASEAANLIETFIHGIR
jgi:UDP:flavonoid glycosyltransferase YjiC (YdhE family)